MTIYAFEKLPPEYQVSYGNITAPVQVTEYFSFSCSNCLKSFKKDFEKIKAQYIDNGKVHWIFHLNPSDLLTLKVAVCLEKLSLEEKRIFWEVVIDHLDHPSKGDTIIQTAMDAFNKPIPQLHELTYLEETFAFKSAYQYLQQPGIVSALPTIEINGKIYDEYPSRSFIEKQLSALLTTRKDP